MYEYEEVSDTPFTSKDALALYDLEHFEVFWEKSLDTKVVAGWNDDTVSRMMGNRQRPAILGHCRALSLAHR